MALTFTELESVTNDYFLADNKKAIDIYFNTSFLIDYFMNKKKGIWERPAGGNNIRIPLEYDEQVGGFYARADTLSSDDRETVNSARFGWKHAYGNATIYRADELQNVGEYAEVQLVTQKVAGAQKTLTKKLATEIYSANTDSANELTGLRSLTSETATVAYGGIIENDLVATDGTKPWEGKTTTTTEGISLAVIRTAASAAKINDGAMGKPDIGLMTETLFNIVSGILQVQQRFTQDTDTAKAGFTNLVFEKKILVADDYCTSGYMFLLNSNYCGFAVHKQGLYARTPWGDLIVTGTVAKSMKIFWDGNFVCSNRKAHIAHSNLS
jgi:hypothetical protein